MNCLIQVRGISTAETSDTTEVMTRGLCREISTEYGDGYRIDYRTEDPDNPKASVLTKITVTDHAATIQRTGGLQSTFTIIPGEKHPCDYTTAIGTLSFDIVGKKVSVVRDGDRIVARLSYDIVTGDSIMASNDIEIIVEKNSPTSSL